jgi:HEAT repeat protein
MTRFMLLGLTLALTLVCARAFAAAPAGNVKDTAPAILSQYLPGMADADPGKRYTAMNEFSKICLRSARAGADDERVAVCMAITAKLGSDTPPLVRAWLIRQLQWVGKAEVVPALTTLLSDKDKAGGEFMVRDCARRALEANPAPEAGKALLAAMAKPECTDSEGSIIGLMNSLAARHDAAAVPAIVEQIKDKRIDVTLAAVSALGRIGTPEAAAALEKVQAGTNLAFVSTLQDAQIRCAERLLADGKKDAAGAIYTRLYAAENPLQIRVAALRGMVATEGDKAVALLTGILAGKEPKLQPFALPILLDIPGPDAAKAVAAVLPSVPPSAQVPLIEMLRERADPSTKPAILAAMKSTDENVRAAATKALAAIGQANDVPSLLQAATSTDTAQRDAARYSLDHLPESVNATLIAAVDTADAKTRPELIRTLAARRAPAALPIFVKAVADADPATRLESLGGIEALGDEKSIGLLISILNKPSSPTEREAAEKALFGVTSHASTPAAAATVLVEGLAGATAATKQSILSALGRTSAPSALAAVKAALKDADAEVQTAALRTLAAWPDASALDDLLTIAQNDPKPANQVLAIRGLVRVTTFAGVLVERQMSVLTKALAAAKRPEDKRLVLGALGGVKSIAALTLAAPLLADNELKEEAATAVTQIAKAMTSSLTAAERPALEQVIKITANDRTRREAQDVLGKMPK